MQSDIKSLIGTVIGYVRINKAMTHHRADYECAAWWRDEQSQCGVFPLTLRVSDHSFNDLQVVAKVPGVVTDCCFVSLFCGNPIGKYDKSRDVGRSCDMWLVQPAHEAVIRTWNSQNLQGCDYYIFPQHWDVIVQWYQDRVQNALTWINQGPTDYSRVWTFGERASQDAKAVEDMRRRSAFMASYLNREPSQCNDWVVKNVDWVPVKDAK